MSDHATLLVADDDEAVRLSLERTLTREGYGVVLAPDGQAALDRLRQAILNLVKNGLEALGRGGKLTVGTRRVADQVEIAIRDTGPGIAPDVGKRLFEQFFTTKPQGTGLGLSITRQIVEEHGGTIRWTSTPGAGATFTITLPIKEAEHA